MKIMGPLGMIDAATAAGVAQIEAPALREEVKKLKTDILGLQSDLRESLAD